MEIININDYVCNKTFHTHVIPFIHHVNPEFHYYKEKNEAVFILETPHFFVFLFLSFVEKNTETAYPRIEDCFSERFQLDPRISNGEWVLEGMYDIEPGKSKMILKEMERFEGEELFHFLKKTIKK